MGKKPFQCSKKRLLRPVKRSTLERESCDKLYQRFVCYGDVIKKKKKDGIRLEIIDPSKNSQDEPMADTFKNTLEVLSSRNCPTINKSQLLNELNENYPNHRFNMKYRKVIIPKTFSSQELESLNKNIGYISANNYTLKFNPRLDQHYLSYNKRKSQ